MRLFLPLIAAVLAACGEAEERPGSTTLVPALLADLTPARDSDEISPVRFPHALHQDERKMGRKLACAFCHHHLEADPASLPMACGRCHPHAAADGSPPDI